MASTRMGATTTASMAAIIVIVALHRRRRDSEASPMSRAYYRDPSQGRSPIAQPRGRQALLRSGVASLAMGNISIAMAMGSPASLIGGGDGTTSRPARQA